MNDTTLFCGFQMKEPNWTRGVYGRLYESPQLVWNVLVMNVMHYYVLVDEHAYTTNSM